MRFDYGDGVTSGDTAFPIPATGGSTTLEHTYAQAGHYTTTFTLFNRVSTITKTVMVTYSLTLSLEFLASLMTFRF
jgi:hypothetical protein